MIETLSASDRALLSQTEKALFDGEIGETIKEMIDGFLSDHNPDLFIDRLDQFYDLTFRSRAAIRSFAEIDQIVKEYTRLLSNSEPFLRRDIPASFCLINNSRDQFIPFVSIDTAKLREYVAGDHLKLARLWYEFYQAEAGLYQLEQKQRGNYLLNLNLARQFQAILDEAYGVDEPCGQSAIRYDAKIKAVDSEHFRFANAHYYGGDYRAALEELDRASAYLKTHPAWLHNYELFTRCLEY